MDEEKQSAVKKPALCRTVAEPNRAGEVPSGSAAHHKQLQTNTQTPLLKERKKVNKRHIQAFPMVYNTIFIFRYLDNS